METEKIIVEVPPQERFAKWYEGAVNTLYDKMDRGDGGIAVLMIALPLYERYIHSQIENNIAKDREAVLMKDLGFSSRKKAQKFWNVFRDGLCHSGSFFVTNRENKNLPLVHLDGDSAPLPLFIDAKRGGRAIITVNPWLFVRHIMLKYQGDQSLFDRADAPLLPLFYIVEKRKTSE